MWKIGGIECHSRLMLGTAGYPSLEILIEAVKISHTNILTVSLKRENPKERKGQSFWRQIQALHCQLLPNTAGCRTALEAVEIAKMSREIFSTNWIKLEVIGDDYLMQPNPFELVKAAKELVDLGFVVFPYCTEELTLCQQLQDCGCHILMPWGSPIGSGKGIINDYYLKILRERFPQTTLIVDAGIGSPIDAMQAMLLGFDGVLVNSAIAKSHFPINMALAFKLAVKSGEIAYSAGLMPVSDVAHSATLLSETLYWSKK